MAEAPLSAEEIAHRGFPSSFRGFDPAEVRAYLVRVANELKAAESRERELQKKIADAERRAANPVIDQAMLARALGDETSRVLASAQQAALELKARAEESVAGILRDAHEQAQRIRAAAEVVLADRTEEADGAAGEIRAAAQAEADAAVAQARREAETVRNDIADQSRQLVQEAQAARARVLNDLTRRRRIAHIQVEQLRAGRERLLDAYRIVRRTLDEVADELERVEPEAREAAGAAARRVEAALAAGADPAPNLPAEGGGEGEATLSVRSGADEPAPDLPTEGGGGGEATLSVRSEAHEPAAEAAPLPAAPAAEPAIDPGLPVRRFSAVAPAPVVAREEHVDERKLSSLRILRRPKPEPVPVPELEVVDPPSAVEGVRVISVTDSRAALAGSPEPPPDRAGPSMTPPDPPAPDPPAPDPPAPDPPAPDPPAPTVEDLFARLRAGAPAVATSAVASVPSPPEEEPDSAPDPTPPDPTPPDHEATLQQRDESIEAIEAGLARKLKRALQDEHNDVLDRLRSCSQPPTTADAFLPSPADQAARYGAAAVDLLREAALSGMRFVSPQGLDVDAPDVADMVAELVDALTGPLRRGVERGVAEAPEDATVLVDCVGAAYRDCRSHRLDRLAGDATIAAFSRGTVSAASGAALRWVVDDGDRACPDCDDNALAGPTPSGQVFPTGQAHPPAHAGCRCLLVTAGP